MTVLNHDRRIHLKKKRKSEQPNNFGGKYVQDGQIPSGSGQYTTPNLSKEEINITPSSTDSSLDFILDVNVDSSTVKIADPDDINFIDQFLET
ncbi:Hypothetical predicted protein [Mytilus galloprovincialis]|nr:Hypothetical predicted protein [Mytilus galloprovincialis]